MTNETTRAAMVFWLVAEAPTQDDMAALFAAIANNDEAAIRALVVASNGPTTDERWEEAKANADERNETRQRGRKPAALSPCDTLSQRQAAIAP